MGNVALSPEEARAIASDLNTGIAQMRKASSNLATIASDLSVGGMVGETGRALARKQGELHADAEKLAVVSEERAAGLNDYANVVEAGQREDAERVARSS